MGKKVENTTCSLFTKHRINPKNAIYALTNAYKRLTPESSNNDDISLPSFGEVITIWN